MAEKYPSGCQNRSVGFLTRCRGIPVNTTRQEALILVKKQKRRIDRIGEELGSIRAEATVVMTFAAVLNEELA